MSTASYLPKSPKQKRSKKRYENILDAAEKIILEKGIKNLSFKNIAFKAKMQRPSLYKLFPNTLSILHALKDRHFNKIIATYERNTLDSKNMSKEWHINLFIDVISIYLNQNKVTASVIFSLREVPSSSEIENNSNTLIDLLLFDFLEKDQSENMNDKILITAHICLSILALGYRQEKHISARYIAEAKKAAISYINTP